MAVYLDHKAWSVKKKWIFRPKWQVNNIYRSTALDMDLIELLTGQKDFDEVCIRLEEVCQTKSLVSNSAHLDYLIVLVALGKIDELINKLEVSIRPALLKRLEQLSHSLVDVVCRARSHITPSFWSWVKQTDNLNEGVLVLKALLATMRNSASLPVDTFIQFKKLPATVQPYALAEYLCTSFMSISDRVITYYEKAKSVVSRVQSAKVSSPLLLQALCLLSTTQQQYSPTIGSKWPFSIIPARTWEKESIPIAALTNIEAVPSEIAFLRHAFFADYLAPIVAENPELKPEVLTIVYADMGDGSDRQAFLECLAPDWKGVLKKERLLEEAQKLTKPYYRARALWRLLRHFPPQEGRSIFREALAAAREVSDYHQRAQVLECLAPYDQFIFDKKKY